MKDCLEDVSMMVSWGTWRLKTTVMRTQLSNHPGGLASSYHGDGGGSNGGADRRSRDNAAQGGAHVHRQYEAFTHRLHVLRTEWGG